MGAAQSDVFALQQSGLEAFLYADVGAEANGSMLTILSVLARLGKDPWAEAAVWSKLPTAAVIDNLAQSIAQMPLSPAALAGARDRAARLVQLLPTHVGSDRPGTGPEAVTPRRMWMLITFLCIIFVVGLALNALMIPGPPSNGSAPGADATPAVTHMATKSIVRGGAKAGATVTPAWE